ncbi:uncharacterized protein CLUP02_08843 [Colletotrichum lupini]|uniref:Uncharacterized protein n=1 Tax=Colletotrichum lupini TaxID=145971 RepID=A0A9Q8WH09_9PEZI|nr:uncharacterized protein CLUP02_08843 [Colletotrichum lupini]KAK1710427.1 hypothetical protein BDP67DRAFT_103011 [Colletotrichum lupini]UQC83348.1 hypothetical protein CLUP02_08843 [Colletotrichum lupini]
MGKGTRCPYVRAFIFFVPLLPLLGLLPMGPASKQSSSTIEIIPHWYCLLILILEVHRSCFPLPYCLSLFFIPFPSHHSLTALYCFFFFFPACSWFSCLPPVLSFVLVPVFKSTIRTDTPAFMESFFLFPKNLPRATHVLSALQNLDGASVNHTLA